MKETVWKRRECVSAEVEDSLVLLDLETLVYHSMNTTAALIWEALATPKSADAITSEIMARYDVAHETCRASVDRTFSVLAEKKLISAEAESSEITQAEAAS